MGKVFEMWTHIAPKARDWGYGIVGRYEMYEGRLITAWNPKARQPWYLVMDLDDTLTEEIISIYRRRWCIETFFGDSKIRDWRLGLDAVELKDYQRKERPICIVALAFIFLSTHGTVAEAEGIDQEVKG